MHRSVPLSLCHQAVIKVTDVLLRSVSEPYREISRPEAVLGEDMMPCICPSRHGEEGLRRSISAAEMHNANNSTPRGLRSGSMHMHNIDQSAILPHEYVCRNVPDSQSPHCVSFQHPHLYSTTITPWMVEGSSLDVVMCIMRPGLGIYFAYPL